MQGALSRDEQGGAGQAVSRQAAQLRQRRGKAGLQPLQQKLQQHIDREDRRIKDLTEAILYHFLPAALRVVAPDASDPAAELAPEQCRGVACAALIVATLMNAPPGFLEFLLCVPWAQLGRLFAVTGCLEGSGAASDANAGPGGLPQLAVDPAERSQLVNLHLESNLVDCVMEFLYREEHRESLPPLMSLGHSAFVPGNDASACTVQLTVAALLDGATPLHCAAARGNPAQVDHLLLCGADVLARTAAGELPLELVPTCDDSSLGRGRRTCRCMGHTDQEAWECRSRLARLLIIKRCAVAVRCGVVAWLRLLVLCFLCVLGFWGRHASLQRPALDAHVEERARKRRRCGMRRAQAALLKMRTSASRGREELDGCATGGRTNLSPSHAGIDADSYTSGSGLRQASAGCTYRGAAERAFTLFTSAVDTLLEIRASSGASGAAHGGALVAEAGCISTEDHDVARVGQEEQGAIYCGWAEAALALCEACGCAGCAAVASHAISAALKDLMHLLAALDQARASGGGSSDSDGDTWRRLGKQLSTVVYVNARLLLRTDIPHSATRAAIWRAQQCLAEWGRLQQLGLTRGVGGEAGGSDPLEIQCLDTWAKSAAADLLLLEAMHGTAVPPLQPLAEVLPLAVRYDAAAGTPSLGRPVSKALVQQLNAALTAARPNASDHIVKLAEAVTAGIQAEIYAGDRLRALLQARTGGAAASEQLAEATAAAARFPSLQEEVAQAEALWQRRAQRAQAQAQLEEAMEKAAAPPPAGLLLQGGGAADGAAPSLDAGVFWKELGARLQELEAAAEGARVAGVNVAKLRKLLKDLNAQGAAVEAAGRLDEALALGKAGSGTLKSVLARAEEAAGTAAGGAGAFNVGADLLTPRIRAARAKLGVERAAEALARAATTFKAVSDLPKLEAAILAARKVGAQELDPGAYRAATEQRVRLDAAAKARAALDAALRSLLRQSRQDDADAASKALFDAAQFGELLSAEVARGQAAVASWQATSAAEVRLSRALTEGVGVGPLSRAIKEAAAGGVNVTEARRVLKVMQGLEAALAAAAAEGPAQYQALQAKVAAAEAGGAPAGMVAEARRTLHHLLLAEVRAELDAALRTVRSAEARPAAQRLATLRAVLDKADAVLSMEGSQQQQAQNEYGAGGAAAGGGAFARTVSDISTDVSSSNGAPTPPLLHDLGGKLRSHSQGSLASRAASSAAGSAPSTPTWTSQHDHAAPALAASSAPAVKLRLRFVGDAVAAWLEPWGGEAEGGTSSEDGDLNSLPADLAGDDVAVVRHMARLARRRLGQEERQQARIERERAEEARLRRELQAREKAKRARADTERAERARAERAERKAALEAQKAERRERERAVRAEKERARQEREDAAREHFLLLQRKRRLLAEQARQAQLAQQAHQLAAQQGALYDSLASTWTTAGVPFNSPTAPALGALLAAAGGGGGGGPTPHLRPDSFAELVSSRSMLLNLLNEQAAAASGMGYAGSSSAPGGGGALAQTLSDPNPARLQHEWTSQGSADGGQGHGQQQRELWEQLQQQQLQQSPDPAQAVLLRHASEGAAALPPPPAASRSLLFGDLGGATWLADNPSVLANSAVLERAATRPPSEASASAGGSLPGTSAGLLWGPAVADPGSHLYGEHAGRGTAGPSLWESTASSGSSAGAPLAMPFSQHPPLMMTAGAGEQQGQQRGPGGASVSASSCLLGSGGMSATVGQQHLQAPSFAFGAPGSREFGQGEFGVEMSGSSALRLGSTSSALQPARQLGAPAGAFSSPYRPDALPPTFASGPVSGAASLGVVRTTAPGGSLPEGGSALSQAAASLPGSAQATPRAAFAADSDEVGRQFGLPSETSLFTDLGGWEGAVGADASPVPLLCPQPPSRGK